MPKRILDGDALWKSDKIGRLPDEVQSEYANLIPLALANGVFEYNPDRIWSMVYSFNRPKITKEITHFILKSLRVGGLLFVWEQDRKQWGYWVGCNKPGRLPGPSRQGTNEAIGPNPPLNLLEEYEAMYNLHSLEESTDSDGIQKLLGLGFGLGLGLGKGVGLGTENTHIFQSNTSTTEEPMSWKKDIQEICLRSFGILERSDGPVWSELSHYHNVFGREELTEAFQKWADQNSGPDITYPIFKFCRVANQFLLPEFKKVQNPDLKPLVLELTMASNKEVTFDEAQVRKIGKLLEIYTKPEILLAFKEYYARLDEFALKGQPAKKFIETCSWLIEANRKYKSDAEEQKTRMEAEITRLRVEDANKEAERVKAEAAEEPDEFFDSLVANQDKR